MAGYLLIRKNNNYSLVYSINGAISTAVWTITALTVSISSLPTAINFAFNFLIDFYGFINLKRELKQQTKKEQETNNLKSE